MGSAPKSEWSRPRRVKPEIKAGRVEGVQVRSWDGSSCIERQQFAHRVVVGDVGGLAVGLGHRGVECRVGVGEPLHPFGRVQPAVAELDQTTCGFGNCRGGGGMSSERPPGKEKVSKMVVGV